MKTNPTTFSPLPIGQFGDLDTETTRSPAVKAVEVYAMDGAQFPTFEKAIEHRENQIEAFVRPMLNDLDPTRASAKIAAIQWILDNRAELRRLLDY